MKPEHPLQVPDSQDKTNESENDYKLNTEHLTAGFENENRVQSKKTNGKEMNSKLASLFTYR